MKIVSRIGFFLILSGMFPGLLRAQYTFFTPEKSFAVEVSLPNTQLKRLPMYRNSISSLATSGDRIIAGTSAREGLSPFIFTVSLGQKELIEMKDLDEVIKGQNSIRTGFAKGNGNSFYAGTIANKKRDGSEGDGHLFQLEIGSDNAVKIRDLGVPLPGEGVFALTSDLQRNFLYGITYPSGQFFTFNLNTREAKTYKNTVVSGEDMSTIGEYDLKPQQYLSKSLIISNGLVYGSMPINKLFYFDPKDESFHTIGSLPEVWGRRVLGQAGAWAVSPAGKIYGGNSGDGQLFEIDPSSKKIKNLGKPVSMSGLNGLCFGNDGKLYGIAGEKPGYSHLFSYDNDEGFIDLGNPEFKMIAPGIDQGILWRGFQLSSITTSEDGKYIIMGEDEDLSQLLIFEINKEYKQRQD
jgi:hypothetical protein